MVLPDNAYDNMPTTQGRVESGDDVRRFRGAIPLGDGSPIDPAV
jgi:hypothetical protein